jgi:competence protein ComEA
VIADKLQLDNTTIQKINLNTATEAMLRMHPYIKSNAKMIVAYRTQHGNYTAIEDLKKIKTMDSAAFEKIKNYVTL